MSKIGRKPIDIGNVRVEIKNNEVHYSGSKQSGVYIIPSALSAQLNGKQLLLVVNNDVVKRTHVRDINRIWGLHRALLTNKIKGAQQEFEKKLEINGLGFKAAVSGKKVTLSLGYSHKIDFNLPNEVSLEIDKTGQKLVFKSSNKEILGEVCSSVRALRPPEPYKGTGIKLVSEVIARKAGKTKAA
jgi:large subunit ribosomal protein L6